MESKTRTSLSITFPLLFLFAANNVMAQPIFDQLKAKFEAGQVFKANFIHTYLDSFTQETSNTEGSIWINSIGYRLESEQQMIVVDGELSRSYEEARNRVIISEYYPEDDDFAPSQMLSGMNETYTSSEKTLENGNTLITLETDDDFASFMVVEIEVDSSIQPVKITAYDIADNIIITTFSEREFIENDSTIFEFIIPEDAEIVDMRY